MEQFNARLELDTRALTERLVDQLMDGLADYHPAVGRTLQGRPDVFITVPADDLRQAVTTALAVTAAATDLDVLTVEVMPTTEFDQRMELPPIPDLVSVTEAADQLGVSRQRVLQLLEAGQLAGLKVGTTWVVLRAAVDVRAAMARSAG